MRRLFATTAIVALLSVPAMAQTGGGVESGSDMDTRAYLSMTDVTTLDTDTQGYLASNLMGLSVYTGDGENAEAIGDVNDALIGDDGRVHAVIVGVGGFLGIGEKDVAVDFGRLAITESGEDGFRVVADVTAEELEQAAPFEPAEHDTMASGEESDDGMVRDGQVADQATTDEPMTGEPVVEEQAAADGTMAEEPVVDETANPFADLRLVENGTIDTDYLIDAEVYSSENEYVGDVGNVVLTADGGVDVVIVDVGGFLGMGEKPVAVGFSEVEIYEDGDGYIYLSTPFSETQFDEVPAYEREAYSESRNTMRLSPRS